MENLSEKTESGNKQQKHRNRKLMGVALVGLIWEETKAEGDLIPIIP